MPNLSRSWHELRSGFYDNLPKSLKGPALVRTKVERPEIQHVRSQIVYSKTPSQLSKIESWTDLPLPRLRKKAPRYVCTTACNIPNTVPHTTVFKNSVLQIM